MPVSCMLKNTGLAFQCVEYQEPLLVLLVRDGVATPWHRGSMATGRGRAKAAFHSGYVLSSSVLLSPVFPLPLPFFLSPLISPLLFLAAVFFPLSTQLVPNGFFWIWSLLSLYVLSLHPGLFSFLFTWLHSICSFRVF